ncbi:hypothetical protein ADUPG1_007396, partial [Aduncisulcus paluster]
EKVPQQRVFCCIAPVDPNEEEKKNEGNPRGGQRSGGSGGSSGKPKKGEEEEEKKLPGPLYTEAHEFLAYPPSSISPSSADLLNRGDSILCCMSSEVIKKKEEDRKKREYEEKMLEEEKKFRQKREEEERRQRQEEEGGEEKGEDINMDEQVDGNDDADKVDNIKPSTSQHGAVRVLSCELADYGVSEEEIAAFEREIVSAPKKKDDLFGVEKNTGPFQPSRPSSLPLFSVDIGSSRKEMIPVWPPSIGEIIEPIVDTAVCVMPISDEFQHVNEGVRAKLCSEEHDVHGDNAMSGGDEAKDKVEGDDVIEEEDHNAQTTSPTQTQDNKDDEEEGHVLKSRHKPSEVLEPFNFSSISQMNASYLHMLSEIRGVSVDELIESIDPSVFSLVYELFNVLSMGTMG